MRRMLAGFLMLIVLILIGVGVLVVYAKTRGFTAKARPSAPERFIAHRLLELSYPAAAKSMQNPLQATPEYLTRAHDHYMHDCAVCHGDDGAGKTEIARGLYPKVPNLRHESDMTDGELFFIIKNGIRFTGMPGWSDPDDEIWKLVLFIRDLPNHPAAVNQTAEAGQAH
jgi:mono/diheme cytochrome c family protein